MMDAIDKALVRVSKWINRHIFRMNEADNLRELLREFSGSSHVDVDTEYGEYILTLFES
jgi:hypothetical protein